MLVTSRAVEIADDTSGQLIGAAHHHANNLLEGLHTPVGIAAQMLALQSATNSLGDSPNASLNRPKTVATLQDKCPMLIALSLAVCEVATANDLPVHWHTVHATLKATEWAAHHANALDLAGSKTNKPTPVTSLPSVQNMGNGCFTSASTNNLTEGMSIFRIQPSYMPCYQECLNCNRMFEVFVQGVGAASFKV